MAPRIPLAECYGDVTRQREGYIARPRLEGAAFAATIVSVLWSYSQCGCEALGALRDAWKIGREILR
jgi:hypothetical protein